MFSAFNYYIIEPLKMNSFSHFRFRLFQKMHELTNGRISVIIRKFKSFYNDTTELSQNHLNQEQLQSINQELENLGWSILPFKISNKDLSQIQHFLLTTPCYSNHPHEQFLLPAELKKETPFNRYIWSAHDILSHHTLSKIVTDSVWPTIARHYLNGHFVLSNLQIWLDPAPSASSKINDSHFYHYDIDNPKFLKFFIYLTDMDKDTGAHCYIQKTHQPIKDSHFSKSKRYSDQEIYNHYGFQNEKLFSAPAGTIIAEDTLGFHKGSTPIKDYRALLQLQFSYFEIPDNTKIQKVTIANIPENIRKIYQKYVQ